MSLCRSSKSVTRDQYGPVYVQASDFCCCSIDKTDSCMVPPAGLKLHACWICRSGVYKSHRDDDAGSGDGLGVSTTDRFTECALIQVISTESELRRVWYESDVPEFEFLKHQSNRSYQSGNPQFGVLKELNCDWSKELMEICLLLTHQLLILSKTATYTAEF